MAFIEIDMLEKTENWNMNDLHSHPHYEIYYLEKGERMFFLSNALYKITAPTLVIIPPYIMHKTEGGPFSKYNVNVEENYLNSFEADVLKELSLKIIIPDEKQNEEIIRLLQTLKIPYKNSKHSDAVTQTLFSYFILKLSELKTGQAENVTLQNNRVPPVILKIIDYLNENYSKCITLDTISKEFFISAPTIIYNFKKHTNCAPIEFLLNVRLNKAKQLLVSTNISIGKIADMCGFSSANYFGLIFKKKEGISPAKYRKHKKC